MSKLHGASYELEHCTSKATVKKHASNLSPYPAELIPFRPLDGADNQFGQLNPKFKEHPYREAGITGFIPPTPLKLDLTGQEALRKYKETYVPRVWLYVRTSLCTYIEAKTVGRV